MRSLARVVLSILLMISLAAPASAWHAPDQKLPTVTSAMPGNLWVGSGSIQHDQTSDDLAVHEQTTNHAHDAAGDLFGSSSDCDFGCEAAFALTTGELLLSQPRAAPPSAMAEFALDHRPSGLFRPPCQQS